MAKWVEYFIASRTARSGSSEGGNASESGMMATISAIAVALSLIVMILTIAIVLGFKREVHSRLTALSGDVIISTYRGVNPSIVEPIRRSEALEGFVERIGETRYITPYVARSVIVRSEEGVEGVILKGVDSTFRRGIVEEGLVEGAVPEFGGAKKSRNAIISKALAAELGLKVGSKLELLVTQEGGDMRRDLYKVGAIYSAATGEAERALIMVDMRNVQRLNGWRAEEISGYEVGLVERDRAVAMAEVFNRDVIELDAEEFDEVAAFATQQFYPGIFDWLNTLDLNALVVLSIMMFVAIFNIITAILILVLERMQMIGVLKTLGMTNASIGRIFLHRAFGITLRGVLWGNAIALVLALMQQRYQIIKLDETGYLLSSVPIELGVGWIVLLNAGVVLTILLSVSLPSRIVGSIEPHKAVKFQ